MPVLRGLGSVGIEPGSAGAGFDAGSTGAGFRGDQARFCGGLVLLWFYGTTVGFYEFWFYGTKAGAAVP